jgi:hypothetical protein
MKTFDHLKLTKRDGAEAGRLLAYLRSVAGTSKLNEFRIAHEADNRCCRRESWPRTFRRILAALAEADKTPAAVFDPTTGRTEFFARREERP